MKVAFGHIHYTPEVFWSMSLREWQATVKGYVEKEFGGEQQAPMTSKTLEMLMKEYPDDRSTN